jgi:hypothetical protein
MPSAQRYGLHDSSDGRAAWRHILALNVRGARALAWLGCAMTTFTVLVSVLFDAGWRAVEQNDPNVFFRGITFGAAVAAPVVLVFLGLAAWNAYLAKSG